MAVSRESQRGAGVAAQPRPTNPRESLEGRFGHRAPMSVIQKFESMEYGPAPEDPKESLRWLEGHKRRFGHFIAGAWRAPAEGKYFETADPSTGETIAE